MGKIFACSKKAETKNMLENKLEQAQQRKTSLEEEKHFIKIAAGIDHFKRHWNIREEARQKDAQLFDLYEQEMRKNVEVM